MSNKYSKAISDVAARENMSASNRKKVEKLALLSADKSVYNALRAQNVDVARFNKRALYASEKAVKIVHAATREVINASDLNENALATIKSAILAKRADKYLTKRDIECALSSDQKIADDRDDVVYRRKSIMSASTLAAQSQQCVDMLKTLRVVDEIARNTFAINDSELMQRFETVFADVTL